jgi:hypothetical protein
MKPSRLYAPHGGGSEAIFCPLKSDTTVAALRNLAARSALTIRRRLARSSGLLAMNSLRWLRLHTVGDGRPMPGDGQVNLMMLRTCGRAHCTSPIILGCSQRSRQVVEQKHARPCWISPVAVTR